MKIFYAPGRVNLIGEHTDYNGGFVLPVNIDRTILLACSEHDDNIINFKSINFADEISTCLDNIVKDNSWADYPKGIIYENCISYWWRRIYR